MLDSANHTEERWPPSSTAVNLVIDNGQRYANWRRDSRPPVSYLQQLVPPPTTVRKYILLATDGQPFVRGFGWVRCSEGGIRPPRSSTPFKRGPPRQQRGRFFTPSSSVWRTKARGCDDAST